MIMLAIFVKFVSKIHDIWTWNILKTLYNYYREKRCTQDDPIERARPD
jgi:hypothetical protein